MASARRDGLRTPCSGGSPAAGPTHGRSPHSEPGGPATVVSPPMSPTACFGHEILLMLICPRPLAAAETTAPSKPKTLCGPLQRSLCLFSGSHDFTDGTVSREAGPPQEARETTSKVGGVWGWPWAPGHRGSAHPPAQVITVSSTSPLEHSG